MINSSRKIAGYKINSLKVVTLLHINGKQIEKEVRETTPFKIVCNNTKYVQVTLIKQVKNLCDEIIKSLKKKLKVISENGSISHIMDL